MPKRPPSIIEFNPDDTLHVNFVSTLAYLRAKLCGVNKIPENWRSEGSRRDIAK